MPPAQTEAEARPQVLRANACVVTWWRMVLRRLRTAPAGVVLAEESKHRGQAGAAHAAGDRLRRSTQHRDGLMIIIVNGSRRSKSPAEAAARRLRPSPGARRETGGSTTHPRPCTPSAGPT